MKTKNTIGILGGYGNTGELIAALLLKKTDANIVLLGRNEDRAEALTKEFNQSIGTDRVTAAVVDAANRQSLRDAFKTIDLIVVASSTTQYCENVVDEALAARIDYFDVQYSTKKLDILQSKTDEIKNSDCCFLTEGGFHPGLPAAMVRYIAPRFDRITKANVGSVIQIDWAGLSLSKATSIELVSEFGDFKMLSYNKGQWKNMSVWSMMFPKWMQFGHDFRKRYTFPMFLEEMRSIPDIYPSLEETGFFVGGFNWFVDFFLLPIMWPILRLFPNRSKALMAKWFLWGLKTFSREPFGTLLNLEAEGLINGKPSKQKLTICHEDGYMLTAIPTVACILQLLNGSIRQPGLWFQAHIVDPDRFITDMKTMGTVITEKSVMSNE